MSPPPLRTSRRRPDLWRRILFATFLLLLYWRCNLPAADETPFIHFIASAYAHDSFQIVDPDESRTAAAPNQHKPTRKYDAFPHQVLDIDSGEAPVSQAKYALLDSIIDDAKKRIVYNATLQDPQAQRDQAELILATIDQVLTDHNILYPPGDYDVTSLRAGLTPQHYDKDALARILRVPINKRRRDHARAHATEPFYILDCDISSFVYIGVADAIGLDLHLVDLPDHMFVRWELEDGSHLNWDTNDAQEVTDKELASDYGLGKRIRKQRIYLASMTRREAEGFAYFLRATRFEERDEDAKAIADLKKARDLYPQSTQVASELAWLYATAQGVDLMHRKLAIDLAQSVVDLEPKCGDFWDSLAAAHAANGNFKQATKEARQAEILAESPDDRAEFKMHRKAFEKSEMPDHPRGH